MGRKLSGWLDGRSGRWLARIGEKGSGGKPRAVILRDVEGRPLGRGASSEDVARAMARKIELRDGQGHPGNLEFAAGGVNPDQWTFGQLADAYVAWMIGQGRRRRTYEDVRYHLARFGRLPTKGGRQVSGRPLAETDLDFIAAGHWFDYARQVPGQLRQTFAAVRACLAWAARPVEGRVPPKILELNPFAGIVVLPVDGVDEVDGSAHWTWAETRRLLRLARGYAKIRVGVIDGRCRLRTEGIRRRRLIRYGILAAIAYTGARPGEILGLRWSDLDVAGGVIRLPAARVKTGRPRLIPLAGRLRKAIEFVEKRRHRDNPWVWGIDDEPPPRLSEFWRYLRDDLWPYAASKGFPRPPGWRPYWLRYSWATDAVESVGADLAASALGHSPEITRAIYDRVTARRVARVGEAVARARRQQ